MEAKAANIYDIARYSGVSIGTVSRVLNNHRSVREETRARVLEAMNTLNYEPSLIARRLGSGRTSLRNIAFLLSNRSLQHSFHLDLVLAAENAARAHGYSFVLCTYNYSPDQKLSRTDLPGFLQYKGAADGLIVSGLNYCNLINKLRALSLPMVIWGNNLVCRDRECFDNCSVVSMDTLHGTSLLVEHLVDLGHASFAFVGLRNHPAIEGPGSRLARILDRHDLALRENAVALVESGEGVSLEAAAEAAVTNLIAERVPFTVVVASYNIIAVGVVRALRAAGLRVPEDVSVVTSETCEIAGFTEPALTSIRVDSSAIGSAMVSGLVRQMDSLDPHPSHVLIPTDIALRGSTAPAPMSRPSRKGRLPAYLKSNR